ncbi:hypothetical protein BD310DRAFT_906753 [Dichomitus squalens]|uniref:Uncharacterized protein n=1 Tax=Dichomitus squalens TaxID=114155 RepID=A0A4Q9PU71_9APHY|nr:hypothetical protein BD310DRAFT_906753 [Dichomitus squalens]
MGIRNHSGHDADGPVCGRWTAKSVRGRRITKSVSERWSGRHARANGSGKHAHENGSGRHACKNGSGRHACENGSGMYAACEASPWSILACAGKPTGSNCVRRCGGSRAKNGDGFETCEGGVVGGGTTIVAEGEEEGEALAMAGDAGPLALAQEFVVGQVSYLVLGSQRGGATQQCQHLFGGEDDRACRMGVWAQCALPMHDEHSEGIQTQPHSSKKHGLLQDDCGADPIDQQTANHDQKKTC